MMKLADIVFVVGLVTLVAPPPPAAWALQEGSKELRVPKSKLPAAVRQAIKDNCTNCAVDKVTREVEHGVTIYDIEFKRGQGEMDVTETGSVIDRETVVQAKDVPPLALDAIRNASPGTRIKQIAKDEVRAELKDGKVIKLDAPKYLYEADLVKGNLVAEIQVTPEGQVTEAPKWRARGAKEN